MDNILALLGLALRAGKLAVGEEQISTLAHAHKVYLMLLASDAAENSTRRAGHYCQEGKTICLPLPFTRTEIGEALGRSSCAILALGDTGFAASVAKKLYRADPEQYGSVWETLKRRDDRARQRKTKKKGNSPGNPSGRLEKKTRIVEDSHDPQQS